LLVFNTNFYIKTFPIKNYYIFDAKSFKRCGFLNSITKLGCKLKMVKYELEEDDDEGDDKPTDDDDEDSFDE